jgi:hypothetical protein
MTKLARTHIPTRWPQDELVPITHGDHLLLALQYDRRERSLGLWPPGEPALERFGCCKQFACNSVGGDTGGSGAP